MTTTTQRIALQDFAEGKDRGSARYFVGRTAIIDGIARNLQRCIRYQGQAGYADNWSDQTTLLQGAPGAGKSALLEHLKTELPQRIQSDRPLRFCLLDPKDLISDPRWEKKLAEALKPGSGEQLGITESVQLQGGVNTGLLQAGGQVTAHKPLLTWDGLLMQHQARQEDFHPVILLIDEVQNIRAPNENRIAMMLEYFHKATDQLPVFPVYGGLGYTEDRLRALGLSRLTAGRVTTLSCLTDEDCHLAVARFLADPEFGIQYSIRQRQKWQTQVAALSNGWPQHLTIALRALAAGIAKSPHHTLDTVAEANVIRHVQTGKNHYYQARLRNGKLQNRTGLAEIGIVLVHRHACIGIPDLARKLETIAGCLGPQQPGFALPGEQTGEQFVQAMFEAGLLHKKNEHEVEVPIPSLVTYVEQGPTRRTFIEETVLHKLLHAPAPVRSDIAGTDEVAPAPRPGAERG